MTNVVLLNAGEGYRTRSYGPKCLLKLANKETLLNRQERIIKESITDPEIFIAGGFESYKIEKKTKLPIHDKNDPETNQVISLLETCKQFGISETFVVFGDVAFQEFPSRPKNTTFYTQPNSDSSKLGVYMQEGGLLSFLMWGLPATWSEIAYIGPDMLQFLFEHQDRYTRAFLFEALNDALAASCKAWAKPLQTPVYDVDEIKDLKTINKKFNICAS